MTARLGQSLKRSRTATACLAGICAFAACLALAENAQPTAPKDERRSQVYAELAKAPEKARNRTNPLASDPDAVPTGKKLFEAHCSECHGDTGDGGKKGPSLRAEEVQQATPGTIFWVVTNGVVRRGMPVWSKLPEPQRWQIVSYIRSLGTNPK
jgi:mono/diheme cytochrome c family protein